MALSDTIYLFIGFRKSTPPQNRQPNISSSDSKQYVDDLDFLKLINNT